VPLIEGTWPMTKAPTPFARATAPGSPVDAVIFDINGTIIDIETEEWGRTTLRQISRYLSYIGISCGTSELVELVRGGVRRQVEASTERHPEFDAVELWRTVIDTLTNASRRVSSTSVGSRAWASPILGDPELALHLAQLQRALSRRRLRPYPEVEEVLAALRPQYRLAIVSDAQKAYARSELAETGLSGYFDAIVVSGELGFRKPDRRIFDAALAAVGTTADRAIFVGNDMHRDVFGPAQLGMRTIFTPTRFGDKDFPGAKPDYVAHNFGQVLDGVQRLAGR
jgi:putative hydrolase of the HAD superfamily